MLVAGACGGDDAAEPTPPEVADTLPGDTAPAPAETTVAASEDAAPAPELGGTSWRVTDYTLPGGSFTNVWDHTEVIIQFGADGTATGNLGCNDFTASFVVEGPYDEFEDGVRDANDGQLIRFESIDLGAETCDDDNTMEQELEILDHLENAGRWLIVRGNFNLRSSDGAFLLEGEPAS